MKLAFDLNLTTIFKKGQTQGVKIYRRQWIWSWDDSSDYPRLTLVLPFAMNPTLELFKLYGQLLKSEWATLSKN